MNKIYHEIKPVFNSQSKVLILGTMPSPKSRETGFFYGHTQNRFWKVLSGMIKAPEPKSIEEKKFFLLNNNIAIWDVLSSCEIEKASDSSIKNPEINDITVILNNAPIKAIFTNGSKAFSLYNKLLLPKIKKEAIPLPSTSPANARFTFDDLIVKYSIIKNFL